MAIQQDSQARIKERLGDRLWRLENLYYIKDEKGQKVKFRLREAQRWLYDGMWYSNCILKARQLGFSTFIVIYMLDAALFNSNHKCGLIDYALSEGKKKLDKVKFAYENLPEWLKQEKQATKWGAEEIEFNNGSGLVVGTSHRGDTLQKLHISEYGKIAARYPEKAEEIKTGALNAVHSGQQVFVESTAEGRAGQFYELVMQAMKLQQRQASLTPLDPKFHFYPWWQHPGYEFGEHDTSNTSVTAKMADYFADVEAKCAIMLRPGQKAWYVKKAESQGDKMKREFPSTPEEAFEASMEGAYYTREMAQVRQNKQICRVPYEVAKPVDTFWDLGGDTTAVWFFQHIGMEYRFLRYMEFHHSGLPYISKCLKELPYNYGTHYWPHDGSHHQLATGQKLRDTAYDQGIKPIQVISRTNDVQIDIDAFCRPVLPRCWFDEENCDQGIKHLDNYRKEWDERLGDWKEKHRNDAAAHGADAFRTFAVGYQGRKEEFTDHSLTAYEAESDFDELAL